MKTFARILLAIVLLILVLLVGSQLQAQTVKMSNGVAIVTPPAGYTTLYTTYSTRDTFFSELTQSRETNPISVSDMANLWFIGKDTVSVWVITPKLPGDQLTVFVNGVCTRNNTKADPKFWAYDAIVPMIEEYYQEEE